MRLREDVAIQELDGETILLDLASGTYLKINKSGTMLLAILADADEAAAARLFSERFDLDAQTSEADVAAFAAALRSAGLVDETAHDHPS